MNIRYARIMPAVKPRTRRLVGAVAMFVGLVALVVSLVSIQRAAERQETWSKAEGVVTHYVAERNHEGEWSYVAQFRFTAEDGSEYHARSGTRSNLKLYAVGETVPLIYPCENPAGAMENTFWGLYMEPVFFALFAGIVGGCGFLCFVPELFPNAYCRYCEWLERGRARY